MSRLVLLPVLAALMFATTAEASAVRGCRLDGQIIGIEVTGKKKKVQVALKLLLISAEGYGHSAGPADCAAPGAVLDLALTNDVYAAAAGLVSGDFVRIDEATVYNVSPKGKSMHHGVEYVQKITPVSLVAPTLPPMPVAPELVAPIVEPVPAVVPG